MIKAIAVALLLGSGGAYAEPEVVATQPIAFVTRGVEVSYERLAVGKWSWVAIVGARLAAEGDYDSSTLTLGAEVRWWPRRRTPMRGLYVGAHVSGGRTTVSDEMGTIGGSLELTDRVDVGWRWLVMRHLTLAPSLGVGTIEDVDETGRLATTARLTVAFGFEVGWWHGR